MFALIVSALLALFAVFGTTVFHYESLKSIKRLSTLSHHPHLVVPIVLSLVLAAHLTEVFVYAMIYGLALWPLGLGSITGTHVNILTLVYFSAETFRRSATATSCRMARSV